MPGVPTRKGNQYRSEILDFLREYRRQHGFAPSMSELADHLGLARSSCLHHINVLADEGFLTYLSGDPSRTICLTRKGLKLNPVPATVTPATPIRPVTAASSTRRARRTTH